MDTPEYWVLNLWNECLRCYEGYQSPSRIVPLSKPSAVLLTALRCRKSSCGLTIALFNSMLRLGRVSVASFAVYTSVQNLA
jgi:hypothetical protein